MWEWFNWKRPESAKKIVTRRYVPAEKVLDFLRLVRDYREKEGFDAIPRFELWDWVHNNVPGCEDRHIRMFYNIGNATRPYIEFEREV